ncbi:hypothetical protein Tco_0254672, partial [Tanacetum coccineum]
MDLFAFIRTADPIKVRVGERQRTEGKPGLLDTTVGRVVPLLSVAPARDSSELEASVDKLFNKGGDHDTLGGPSVAGKSRSAVQRLLAGAMMNPEVRVAALPTLTFITSSVSATPEHECGDQTDSVARTNLRT